MNQPTSASESIDARIRDLADWRGKTLARVRALIKKADPDVLEEWKWAKATSPGVPVWSHGGILCTGEVYADKVKLTFARGARLADPKGLFNASLDGNTRRAIDLHKDDKLDEAAFTALVRAAVAANAPAKAAKSEDETEARKRGTATKPTATQRRAAKTRAPKRTATQAPAGKDVKLLSGGNPQIPKGDGDAPVQAYIAAMPGWKRAVGEKLDSLVVKAVPHVKKAVKWNSPFYGVEGQGFFLAFHCFTRYVKVTFFYGQKLNPIPPGPSKDANARYLDIHETDVIDEKLVLSWFKQAAAIPGWIP